MFYAVGLIAYKLLEFDSVHFKTGLFVKIFYSKNIINVVSATQNTGTKV